MDFENVKSFVKDMYQNDKALGKKKGNSSQAHKANPKRRSKIRIKKDKSAKAV